jgi:hypothetical protein
VVVGSSIHAFAFADSGFTVRNKREQSSRANLDVGTLDPRR